MEETWRIDLPGGVELTIVPARSGVNSADLPGLIEEVRRACSIAVRRRAPNPYKNLTIRSDDEEEFAAAPLAVPKALDPEGSSPARPDALVPDRERWTIEFGDGIALRILHVDPEVEYVYQALVRQVRRACREARRFPDRPGPARHVDGMRTDPDGAMGFVGAPAALDPDWQRRELRPAAREAAAPRSPPTETRRYTDRVLERIEKNGVLQKLGILRASLDSDPELADLRFTEPSADVVQDPCFLVILPELRDVACLSVKGLVSGRGVRVFLNPADRRFETLRRFEDTVASLADPPDLRTGGLFGRYAPLDDKELGSRPFLSFEDVAGIRRVLRDARARLASRRSPPLDAG